MSTKVTKSTNEVNVMVTKKDVPTIIEKFKEQLKELKGDSDSKVSTDITYNGTNIKNVSTVKELLEISSSINARSEAYDKEIKRYKLDKLKISKFSVSDKTAEEWVKIIDKAIKELINKNQINKLEEAIKKMSKHLDEDIKLQNEIQEIMNIANEAIK